MMTAKQISLVKNSWKLLRDLDAEQLADLFYSKLFFEYPKLRRLFPADMSGQYQKLMATLNVMISRLDQADRLEQELADLGQRHVQYGVRPKHYQYVGAALLWTFECTLGDDWTEPVAEAWRTYYNQLVEIMLNSLKTPDKP